MSKTISIDPPKGYKFQSVDQSTGVINLVEIPIDIKERIKCFDDVLEDHNTNITHFDEECEGLEPEEIAYRKIKMIVKSLNEGWTPDWTNQAEYKYTPWFEMGSASGVGFSYHGYGGWAADSSVGSRLCFKSAELAKYAGTQFLDLYKDFLTL